VLFVGYLYIMDLINALKMEHIKISEKSLVPYGSRSVTRWLFSQWFSRYTEWVLTVQQVSLLAYLL
jgi:hypothetical protein